MVGTVQYARVLPWDNCEEVTAGQDQEVAAARGKHFHLLYA